MAQSYSSEYGINLGLTTKLNDLDYADDICLISHNFSEMQHKLNLVSANASKVGLELNISKTKSLRLNTENTAQFSLFDQRLDDVNEYTYLGSIIDKFGGSSADIQYRINKASQTYGSLAKVWRSSNISLHTKLKIFNSNVKSTLLYSCETWNMSAMDARKMQSFVNRCLRRILRVFWPNTIRNEELWVKTKQPLITETIKTRKYGWLGHTLRKPPTNITRKALEFNPQGSRRRGRPNNTWRRNTEKEIRDAGYTWNQIKRLAEDKAEWKKFVVALCSS